MKNQTIKTTFSKSDEGKNCMIPDIVQYSLAESLILEDIFGFSVIDLFVLILSEEINYKLNVFRTEMYKTISAKKS